MALLFCACSYLPLIPSRHWFFRFFDFIRLQLLALLGLMVVLLIILMAQEWSRASLACLAVVLTTMSYQLGIVAPYFSKGSKQQGDPSVSLLSINVMQENTSYQKVLDLIAQEDPDIVLLMETDMRWETAMNSLEAAYPNNLKIPKDNKYGMHCYTRLKMKQGVAKALIADDHPSVRLELEDTQGTAFCFWGIHPPPPSPTEKPTAKQKDAELLKLARIVAESSCPTVVAGDFNVVCWSRISKRFAELSKLKDARIGRGFFSTFPAQWPLLRFPLDLIFHSQTIQIKTLKVLPSVDSDHLPLFSSFCIQPQAQESREQLDPQEKEEVAATVTEGKIAASKEN
ncbi:endonuclease/exonuclease/phosphatase family protein [Gilvibacter sediminis]|uniref:endonuclease/exonuclease/phosphatase family protein n=1 Tax=Gilvibacter sediminis TaxID=379071 RepID=UPI002350AB7A|nr:endonuclease/exonuclease/phosphatase family protein [Gilvibacter sediminis]MDC7998937.1 endonuclease/exonuclease/phosphatase family protein [Gilvibacter sediminis]